MPYLAFVGALPLRFQQATPPPDPIARPAAAAPPIPPLTPTESTVALANAAATLSAKTAVPALGATPAPEPKPAAKDAPFKSAPRAILPDDTRPMVRPEDFLPYFQIPGTAKSVGEVNVIMPASVITAPAAAPLPPSSATYTQSPK